MAKALFQSLKRASSLLKPSSLLSSSSSSSSSSFKHSSLRAFLGAQESVVYPFRRTELPNPPALSWGFRNLSYGSVNLVMSEGKPKFELHDVDPPKKNKWKTKKRLKLQRKKEKQKRKAANKTDPRRLTAKRRKNQKYANAEERIKDKLERARLKEALLIEKLKRYEVPKVQGPEVKPHDLTGEEKFYLKKMGQKRSNYVPVGRRGIFGGVILNMHMHWKKHETVKVIFKPCKPGQVHEYAQEIARLSGGFPVQILGDDTVVFYRGKDYVQPEVMSPVDTLSKKRALKKSKYEQSLESVRQFIAILEKELELYQRHIALYSDPDGQIPHSILDSQREECNGSGKLEKESNDLTRHGFSSRLLEVEADSTDHEHSEFEDDIEDAGMSVSESDTDYSVSDLDDADGVDNTSTAISSSTILRSRINVCE